MKARLKWPTTWSWSSCLTRNSGAKFLERHDITDEKALGLDFMMRYLMLYDRTDVLPLPLEGYPLTNKGDRVQWPHAWKFESLTMALQRTVKKRRPDLVFSYAYTICQLCYWYGTQGDLTWKPTSIAKMKPIPSLQGSR